MVRIIGTIIRTGLALIAGTLFAALGSIFGPLGSILGFIFGVASVGRIRVQRVGSDGSGVRQEWSEWRRYQEEAWRRWQEQGGWNGYGGYQDGGRQGGYQWGYPGSAAERESNYSILGVPPSATDEELKASYRNLALKYHPDRYTGRDEAERKAAEDKFKEINAAYDAIKNERGL